jgi:hypothetical protein
LIYFLTTALAFIVNVAILVWAARRLAAVYQNRLIAILGTVFVGVALSVLSDFTVAYSVDGYDRSIQAVIERGAMSGLLAIIVGYVAIRQPKRNSVMASLIGRLVGRLSGFEWRLYFVRKGVGLEYALHNKDGFALLGYLQAKFCDGGERISDGWKLFLSYYSGRKEEHFQLTEAMFTDASEFRNLIAKCRALDKNFDDGAAIGWNPTFRHVPTRKQLPLGGPTDTDWENISKYVERQFEEGLSGKDDGTTFSKISDEVFVTSDVRLGG